MAIVKSTLILIKKNCRKIAFQQKSYWVCHNSTTVMHSKFPLNKTFGGSNSLANQSNEMPELEVMYAFEQLRSERASQTRIYETMYIAVRHVKLLLCE